MNECFKCDLSITRKHQVHGRGDLPCDILFIGEAPGKSENVTGKAFCGPSGKILNSAIKKACELSEISKAPKFYITNTVQCRPCDSKQGPNRQPTCDEILACRENLEKIFIKANPRVVILVGKVAEMNLKQKFTNAYVIQHPAYLLRKGGVASPEFRRMASTLSYIFNILTKEKKNA